MCRSVLKGRALVVWLFAVLAEFALVQSQNVQFKPVTDKPEHLPVPSASPRHHSGLTCPRPSLEHGTVTLIPRGTDRIYPGDVAQLVCDQDFELKTNDFLYSNSYMIRCSETGQWTTPHGFKQLPTCKAKTCELPPSIPYGMYDIRSPHYTPDYGKPTGAPVYGSRAHYSCVEGFVLEDAGSSMLQCVSGDWQGTTPVCIPRLSCPKAPDVTNSECTFYSTSKLCNPHAVDNGKRIYYRCQEGFSLIGNAVLQCDKGEWSLPAPTCHPDSPMCGPPPMLLHGERTIYPQAPAGGVHLYQQGAQAAYYCLNGYSFVGDQPSVEITCQNGEWIGTVPRCMKRLHCGVPQNIPNGNWVVLGPESKFSVGMTISYDCNPGYAPYGKTKLTCLSSGYWSDNPPKCFEKGTHCPDPGKVDNGFYVCQPRHCSLFSVGTSVSYMCESGYEPLGDIAQTCLRGSKWSGSKPVCMPIMTTPRMNATLGINTGTVTVVIATTCCVLGLLLVVMIVVALQRRKPTPRLCHPVQPPPPAYPRPRSDSMDEHDRVALIASADGVHVVLPSYEEAVRGGPRSSNTRFNGETPSVRRGDYRPLPTIPASMRGCNRLDSPRSGQVSGDHHRNSIITNSSLARDNISLAFGSIDTMNISDGTSTSVTIETFDSGASNPSLALSQRAVTGSLGSSNGSLANEDAPLLDNISLSESGRSSLPQRPADTISTDEQKQE